MPIDLHATQTAKPRQYVLDTNVLISDPSSILNFEEHDVVIPFIVLEELDRIKDNPRKTEVQFEARSAIHLINSIVNGHSQDKIQTGMPIAFDDSGTVAADGKLRIINSVRELKQTSSDFEEARKALHIDMSSPDNQILLLVAQLSESEKEKRETILVTKDLNMRLKAKCLGLQVEDYRNEQEIQDVKLLDRGFIKTSEDVSVSDIIHDINHQTESNQMSTNIKISASAFQSAFSQAVDDLNIELHANQYIHETKSESIWQIKAQEPGPLQGEIVLRSRNVEALMSRNIMGIQPKNTVQALAIDALLDDSIDLVVISGPAGSGKTLIALAAGLQLTMEDRRFEKIIVTRNTVDMGEPIGFLPGTEEEKMAPWLAAYSDTLDSINAQDEKDLPNTGHERSGHQGKVNNKDAKQVSHELYMRHIQFRSMTFMRGRSFRDAFIILDESQNLTRAQIKSLITRVGPGSKVVILGNVGQIDARWNSPTSNGLVSVAKTYKNFHRSTHIILEGGQRSAVASYAEENL